ncbi:MAG: HAD-IIA family hydrolase [Deltaproteobacteria bacterium]|nr:HAD-IIA family hydrolase [Deltaproteobacteria bacterium]
MKLVDLFDHFLIDLDGVVYVGDKPTVGAEETLKALRQFGKRLIFLTNDPRGSSRDYSEKLKKMNIQAGPDDVITSGMAIAHYIKEHYQLNQKKAYVVGSPALKEEIEQIGIKLSQGEDGRKADFVIVGGHSEFHYEELKYATLAIRNGAHFFATNRDPVFPAPEGLVPGTGAILASIEVASGKKAITAGKPEPIMFEVAKKVLSSQERTAIIGDRLDTDIVGGKRVGIKTILVLSGSTKQDEIPKSEIKPDYVINDLRDLLKEQAPITKPQVSNKSETPNSKP